FFNQGPAKTTFQARITEETRIGDVPGVVVEITGNAQITGYHQFVLDPNDPFPQGFLL
ncbi:MAG: proline racemase family protein, partial [Desulfohalobiaceae bacterium]|nr:proline racemase family protein [Desulfohalobiaceae bacterium]